VSETILARCPVLPSHSTTSSTSLTKEELSNNEEEAQKRIVDYVRVMYESYELAKETERFLKDVQVSFHRLTLGTSS
jgi:hypothetical protein